jgi:hypothetical protein
MSRWTQYRDQYRRRRNAFRLLTMSGAIRSADVEVPYFRERRAGEVGRGGNSVADLAAQSIWSMDLRRLFCSKARRPLSLR